MSRKEVGETDSKTCEKGQIRQEQTTLRLPVELLEALKQEADKKGYTVTDLITFILWDYVH